MIQEFLLLLMIVFSICVVTSEKLLRSVIYLAASTLILVIILFLFQAPDVAITLAVVGTGATTILYLSVLNKVGELR